jgi:signal transduction histidine kinase
VDASGPGPFVAADPAALEQVVVNLLDNAVKYSDEVKDVTVRVRSAGRLATIDVVDRGVGIGPGQQARIFERFYRAGDARHRQGFGLGLPIVRELVQAHGGRVEVASTTPGAGSTFRVTLPCEPVGVAVPPLPAAGAREVTS